MRLLGIDYGTKNVGLALTDQSGRFASAYAVLATDENLVPTIKAICEKEKVERIIIGESLDIKGQPNPVMKKIEKFREKLAVAINLPIEYEPEFMTSVEAARPPAGGEKFLADDEMSDARAAAIILKSYVDKLSRIKTNLPDAAGDTNMDQIKIEDWAKVEVRVGEIKSAEKIPETDKLLRLEVDFGEEKLRQIVSGIAAFFPEPNILVGKKCAFVTNLEPRMLKGFESRGMILAAKFGESLSLLEVSVEIAAGTKIS
jgi:putative transcription antitermination factor YqgF